jgi:endogenous inhibitor of DNA gyrase (YacG/DUF329 family)
VILPALAALIDAGHAGLVVDVKGNMGAQVHEIARGAGREGDVVEFGTCAEAREADILDGMDEARLYDFLRTVATAQIGDKTQNRDWQLKGVNIGVEIVKVLRHVRSWHPSVPATVAALHEILCDWDLGASVFGLFKSRMSEADDPAGRRLVSRIESDRFTPLMWSGAMKKDRSMAEQTAWRIQAVSAGIALMLGTAGMRRNFACPGGPGLNLERLVYDEGEVVVLRFDASAGPAGAMVARHALSCFQQAVYARGLTSPEGRMTFFIGDEFQEFACFDAKERFNDNAFAARAREFRAIQLVGSQSVSALRSRGAEAAAVAEFTANANNRISFYSDDEDTQKLMERTAPDVRLDRLDAGTASMVKFEMATRRHVQALATFDKAHARLRTRLAGITSVPALPVPGQDAWIGLREMLEEVMKAEKAKGDSVVSALKAEIQTLKMLSEEDGDLAEGDADIEEGRDMAQSHVEALRKLFPDSLGPGFVIPLGWVPLFSKALTAVRAAGLPADISKVTWRQGKPSVFVSCDDHGRSGVAESVLDAIMSRAVDSCMVCGKTVDRDEKDRAMPPFCPDHLDPSDIEGKAEGDAVRTSMEKGKE